jgi:hypothetical protein
MKRTSQPLRRTPLRKVSTKRARELREYSKKRKAFLAAHPWCEVEIATGDYKGPKGMPSASVDIHHKAGRTGWRLNDETQWMAVSREAHEFIHQNPAEARKRGWLV